MSLCKLAFLILVEVSVIMDVGRVRKALERSKLLSNSLAAVGNPTKVLPCVVGQNFQLQPARDCGSHFTEMFLRTDIDLSPKVRKCRLGFYYPAGSTIPIWIRNSEKGL